MTRNAKLDQTTLDPAPDLRRGTQPACLFVGDAQAMRRARLQLPLTLDLANCMIYDLAHNLRHARHPDFVLSYAIGPVFDCMDLAQLLWINGFRGRQRILDFNLPAPRMICKEVKSCCPGLDFAVFDASEFRSAYS